MSNDLQMARGSIVGGYNLAVGEPVVVQRWLKFPEYTIAGPLKYPTMEGHPALLKELLGLHPGREIVITNGAKQALLAAFYALKNVERKTNVWHGQPYWPSYPTLAKMACMDWGLTWDTYTIRCVTAPNNPDGGEYGGDWDVWDAVYAHWMYGWSGREPEHRIAVYSASKLLGLSGARVGWLVTKDTKLAAEARKYIEFTTSGVSVPSQEYVAHALRCMNKDPMTTWFMHQARGDMLHNDQSFRQILGAHVMRSAGVSAGRGMFNYFTVHDPERFEHAREQAKVALVTGAACGDQSAGTYRMNMAQDCQYTLDALEAIRRHL